MSKQGECCSGGCVDERAVPSFQLTAPSPAETLDANGLKIHVYETEAQMGLASALSIASEQTRLVEEKGEASIIIMAAPSAFAFYRAYVGLANASQRFQKVLKNTHFFQFDDYALPQHHAASFRFLLCKNLFFPIAVHCDAAKIHLFDADADDVDDACRRYTDLLLKFGPDLQLKGIGENGHWGFHEPGLTLDADPQFMKVKLSEENVIQQMRDHPALFASSDDVPRFAYTANVPLFLKTRCLIEDNVPQASKAFAILAAYGSDVVHECVPASALKKCACGVVRITRDAARALLEYKEKGVVTAETFTDLTQILSGGKASRMNESAEYIRKVFGNMQIAFKG